MGIDERDALKRLRQDIVALGAQLNTLEQRLDSLETARGSEVPPVTAASTDSHEQPENTTSTGARPIPREQPREPAREAENGEGTRLRPSPGATLGRILSALIVVVESLLSRVSPFSLSAEGLVATYRSYQAEGKATALVMTVAGGAALVLGPAICFSTRSVSCCRRG